MMDKKTLKRLEYYKILEQLASHAGSPLGRERALELEPVCDPGRILRWQAETSEGRELMRLDPTTEIGGWKDIRGHMLRAGREAVLEPEELVAVADTITAGRLIKSFLQEKQERYPLLSELALGLTSMPDLERKIKKSILPGGEVSDSASPELAQIRRRILVTQARIKEHLEQIIRNPNYQKFLQDPIVTVREGRYVIPVKIEHRAQVPGIVHDQSASGATLFVEPMAAVEKNNELRRLQMAEKQEITRILTELSALVSLNAGEINVSLEALGELDFIMARARYSYNLKAWAPEMAGEAFLEIKKGRHPLLKGEVAPVDLRLGTDFDTLVITGPNTGGKTVTLKTAGLLVLMAQSGMHVPAEDGTRFGIFRQVFADIGDEQSIEQSLSTFSSHMTNIVEIVKRASRDSLVLLDELGAGTDPAEGAALAQSILEMIHGAGARTIATTHYSELKNYAYARDRVENASVEFDVATLRPTYRLLIGKPGRSNAFEIATRLGLPAEMVARAREFLTDEQIQVGELMSSLEKTQQEAEVGLAEARRLNQVAAALKEKRQKMFDDLFARRESILSKASEEARVLVKNARQEAEAAVKELREQMSAGAARSRENAIQEAREKLGQLQARVRKSVPERSAPGEIPGEVRPGEEVFLPKFNQNGFVISYSGNEAQVQVGIIKMNVPLKDLRRINKPGQPAGRNEVAGVMLGKAREISSELDLRGRYADEALLQVEKYLDDACLAGLSRVCLIHGKGTGSLRTAIHKQLNGHRRVKSYRLGEHGEGGYGVTVVELS